MPMLHNTPRQAANGDPTTILSVVGLSLPIYHDACAVAHLTSWSFFLTLWPWLTLR